MRLLLSGLKQIFLISSVIVIGPALAADKIEANSKLLYDAVSQENVEVAATLLEQSGDAQEALKLIREAEAHGSSWNLGGRLTYSVQLSQNSETVTVYHASGRSVQPIAAVTFARSKKDAKQ